MSQTSHVHPEPYVHVLITNPFSNNKFRVLFFFLCMQGIEYHLLQLREGYVRLGKAVRLSYDTFLIVVYRYYHEDAGK